MKKYSDGIYILANYYGNNCIVSSISYWNTYYVFQGTNDLFRKNFANRVSKIALIFKKSILIIVFNSIIGNYDVGYPTKIVCLNCLFRFISRFAGSTPAVVIGVMPK